MVDLNWMREALYWIVLIVGSWTLSFKLIVFCEWLGRDRDE